MSVAWPSFSSVALAGVCSLRVKVPSHEIQPRHDIRSDPRSSWSAREEAGRATRAQRAGSRAAPAIEHDSQRLSRQRREGHAANSKARIVAQHGVHADEHGVTRAPQPMDGIERFGRRETVRCVREVVHRALLVSRELQCHRARPRPPLDGGCGAEKGRASRIDAMEAARRCRNKEEREDEPTTHRRGSCARADGLEAKSVGCA